MSGRVMRTAAGLVVIAPDLPGVKVSVPDAAVEAVVGSEQWLALRNNRGNHAKLKKIAGDILDDRQSSDGGSD